AAIAESLVESADTVVHRGEKHQVAWGPGVEFAVGENAGHAELGHILHVAPAEDFPFIGENGIDPGVERAVAGRVVVEVGHGFVQVVQHLRVPRHKRVEHVAAQVEGHAHSVAIVVVRNVVAPVEQLRSVFVRMREVPVVDVHHAVAAINFHHGRDERDDVVANVLNVRAVVHGEAIGQLHEGAGGAGLGGVNRAGDVIDGYGGGGDAVGFGIVHVDSAGVGELGELGAIGLEAREIGFGGDGDGDLLAALFGVANGVDADAGGCLGEQAHVFVDLFGVRENAGGAGDVAEDLLGRGHGLRGGQVVDERRSEVGLRGVLLDLGGVGLVD